MPGIVQPIFAFTRRFASPFCSLPYVYMTCVSVSVSMFVCQYVCFCCSHPPPSSAHLQSTRICGSNFSYAPSQMQIINSLHTHAHTTLAPTAHTHTHTHTHKHSVCHRGSTPFSGHYIADVALPQQKQPRQHAHQQQQQQPAGAAAAAAAPATGGGGGSGIGDCAAKEGQQEAWQWWRFDDTEVSALSQETALSEQGADGYLLFFVCDPSRVGT